MEKDCEQPIPASPETIFKELNKLYWESVGREAWNMIHFYCALRELPESDLAQQLPSEEHYDAFKKLFNAWIGSQPRTDERVLSDLYTRTLHLCKERLNQSRDPGELDQLVARLVLQSSSLLDIDVLYEPTNGSQRCLKLQPGLPNIEQTSHEGQDEGLNEIRGIICGKCRSFIRSPLFYECRQDCKSPGFYILGPHAVPPAPALHECTDGCGVPSGDKAALAKRCMQRSKYRLCAECFEKHCTYNVEDQDSGNADYSDLEPCNRLHLSLVQHQNPHSADARRYRIQLSKLKQNEIGGSKAKNDDWRANFAETALAATESVASMDPRLFLRTAGLMVKGHYAPSGNFHLVLMFGPLLFESGIREINHGVLISPRKPPTLFPDRLGEKVPKVRCPFFYQNKHNNGRAEIGFKSFPARPRPVLADLKRVYGGAFSGYPESRHESDTAVVRCLIQEAEGFLKIRKSKKKHTVEAWKVRSAARLTEQLKSCLGNEVEKHLRRFANILYENKKDTEWSILLNNCQLLANRLLGGEDFEYVVPQLPRDMKDETGFKWPRYLLSFGNHIEGFGKSLYQPNCLITHFCQSTPTIDYDVIDFMQAQKADPRGSSHIKAISGLSLHPDSTRRNSSGLPLDQLWIVPGEALSILQFHLVRSSYKYGEIFNAVDQESETEKEQAWLRNRLRVLQLLDVFASFTGALGVTLFDQFRSMGPDRLSRVTLPAARVMGNMRADEKLVILDQLGPRLIHYKMTHRTPNGMVPVINRIPWVRWWRRQGKWKKWNHRDLGPVGDLEESQVLMAESSTGDDDDDDGRDPVHGEEVVSRIMGFFVGPLSLISPELAVGAGGIIRFHENSWVSVPVGADTYIRQYTCRKARTVRED